MSLETINKLREKSFMLLQISTDTFLSKQDKSVARDGEN